MILTLERQTFLPQCTIGSLSVDGVFQCYTLEDTVRETSDPVECWKIPSATAIPVGTYPVTLTMSNRFKRVLPLLGNVRGFSGVRIHSGNTHEDTEGCILVGVTKLATSVGASRVAFSELFAKLQAAAYRREPITITVTGVVP